MLELLELERPRNPAAVDDMMGGRSGAMGRKLAKSYHATENNTTETINAL